VSALRIAKSIAKQLGVQAGIEVCRGYMLERLRLVKPSDLYKAIKEGKHTLGESEQGDRNFGRKWSRVIEKLSYKGKRIQREYLTATNVLEWLRMDRPDLASLILNMNPDGMKWLEEDVKQVFEFLFPEPKPQPTLTLVKKSAQLIAQKTDEPQPPSPSTEQPTETVPPETTPKDAEQHGKT